MLLDANVPLETVLLGGNITIPTIDGNVEMKIQEGTQPGARKTLKQRGMPKLSRGSSRGDQIVTIKVKMPKLSQHQKDILAKAFNIEQKSSKTKEGEEGGFAKFFKHFTDKKSNKEAAD